MIKTNKQKQDNDLPTSFFKIKSYFPGLNLFLLVVPPTIVKFKKNKIFDFLLLQNHKLIQKGPSETGPIIIGQAWKISFRTVNCMI